MVTEQIFDSCPHCRFRLVKFGIQPGWFAIVVPDAPSPRPVLHTGQEKYVRRRWQQHRERCAERARSA